MKLVLVSLLALVTLGALVVARPPVTGTVWSRGDELALVVAWVVAAAASAWLFLATGACVLALGFARPRLAHRLAPALPLGIRRLVEVAIVGTCFALPALPAHAAGPARFSAVVVDDQPVVRAVEAPVPVVPAPIPRSAPTPSTAPAPARTPARTPAPLLPPAAGPQHVVVRTGDSLWLLARASLTHATGGRPSDTEVAHYWRAVISANRSTLRSGDPSLIFPGEMVALPPPSTVS